MRSPGLVPVFAFAVFALALIQVFTLWPAAADIPLSRPLAGAVVLVSLAGAAWLAARYRGIQPAHASDLHGDATIPAQARAAAWLAVASALTLGMWQWVQLLRLTWARPVYDWDGLYYHVPAMNAWASAGRIHWIPGMADLPFVNGYPMAVEALGFIVHRLTGTSRLLDAGNLFFWPLAALALVVIATALGARGPWRWVPAGLIAMVPGWVILSSTCYVDPAFAATTMGALAAWMLLAAAPPEQSARLALLFGAAGGLMIGAKGQGLPFFALMFAIAQALRTFRSGQDRRRIAGEALFSLVAAFAVGGYWMLRNGVWSGNPIFPIELKLGAKVLAAGYDTGALLHGNLPGWLAAWPAWLRVPIAWLQLDAPIRSYAATGGLGVIWIGAGLPACVILWIALIRTRATLGPLALITGMVALLLAVQPAPWWARMTLWLHALGLPDLAALLDMTSRSRWRGAGYATPLVLIGVLAAGAHEARGAFESEWHSGRQPVSADGTAYRSSAEFIFPGIEDACPGLFESSHIARGPWSRFGTLLGGVLAQPLDARRITPIDGPIDSSTVAVLRGAGVEWVVWDEVQSGPVPGVLREVALDSCAYRPGDDSRFVMARIGPVRALR